MLESTTREKVLKKIRHALINKTSSPFLRVDFDSSVYQQNDVEQDIVFAENLVAAGAHFVFCENKLDLAIQLVNLGQEKKWKQIICCDQELCAFLETCEYPFSAESSNFQTVDMVITTCECMVIKTGSILISSRQSHGRRLPAIAQNHVVVAYTDQLVEDLKDAFNLMKQKYGSKLPSMMSFVTGPSKTADIELIHVQGAHGPREVFLFLLDRSVDPSGHNQS